MINEPALQDALVSAFEKMKSNDDREAALMNEIAAIRETLKELLGDRFSVSFEKHQLAEMTGSVVIESAVRQLADALIQKARDVVIL